MNDKKILIKTENLYKTFITGDVTQHILNNISFNIYEGDFTIIMGSSGSGKSTLLYAISGMDNPTSGHIYFDNEDITTYSSDKLAMLRRKNCGFVFQKNCLINTMTIMDNVLASGLLIKQNKKELIDRANMLFDKVEVLPHTRNKFPTQISGGRAQRVGIVRALINNPKVLFADEPTGSLNSATSLEVLDMFTKFNQGGQSIVMVTHDYKSALRGNRILYLKDGIILGECNLSKYDSSDNESRNNELKDFLTSMGW